MLARWLFLKNKPLWLNKTNYALLCDTLPTSSYSATGKTPTPLHDTPLDNDQTLRHYTIEQTNQPQTIHISEEFNPIHDPIPPLQESSPPQEESKKNPQLPQQSIIDLHNQTQPTPQNLPPQDILDSFITDTHNQFQEKTFIPYNQKQETPPFSVSYIVLYTLDKAIAAETETPEAETMINRLAQRWFGKQGEKRTIHWPYSASLSSKQDAFDFFNGVLHIQTNNAQLILFGQKLRELWSLDTTELPLNSFVPVQHKRVLATFSPAHYLNHPEQRILLWDILTSFK